MKIIVELEASSQIKTANVLKWNTINYIVTLGSKFIITIILQRILEPQDFGIIASILVFTGIAQVIVDNGFQSAIVQSRQLTKTSLSTVFYINLSIGLLCSATLFFLAPFIGRFFGSEKMVAIAQLLSFIYFIQSFSLVQRALLVREHAFKRIAVVEIAASILAGIAAIIWAVNGGGVWSLALMMIGQVFLVALFFWIQPNAWKPGFVFKGGEVRELWKFGSNVFMSGLFIYFNSRIDLLLTGKFLGTVSQGFYSRGKDYGLLPSGILIGIVSKSYFPIFSRLQSEKDELKRNYLTALRAMALIGAVIFPILFLVVGDAIQFILRDKWLGMIEVTEWFIVLSSLYVFNSINANFLAGIGQPRKNLYVQVAVGVVRILAVLLYFYLTPNPDLVNTVAILIMFALVENHFSFLMVEKEKKYGFYPLYSHSYFILMPAWILAFALQFFLRPLLSGNIPELLTIILLPLIFLLLLMVVLNFLKQGISFRAIKNFIPFSKT